MSRLALYLFGPPRVERDGLPLELQYHKNVALLAYLAVAGPDPGGQSHTREALITLLWPELEPSRARANLRRNLSLLRKALDGEWLVVDRETIGLDPGADAWIDVDQFWQRLAACESHGHPPTEACPDCIPLLEEAAALYRDHFLAGFTLRDSAAFDEFQFFQTEGLKDELAGALVRLATYQTSQGDFEAAIGYARRWLALDPLHEPAHRHLMRLYAQSGQRAAALRQYAECERVLEEELGIPVEEETTRVYRAIKERRELPPLASPVPRPAAVRKQNLPLQTVPFVGREAALKEIADCLGDPACRLLTLVGPGGSGKTRLALEAAARILRTLRRLRGSPTPEPSPAAEVTPDPRFAAEPSQGSLFEDGVYFVSLAPLRSIEAIVPTVAEALGFSFYGSGDPRQQLLGYLCGKRMLIIMDNYEHLLPSSSLPPAGGTKGGRKEEGLIW